MILTQVEEFFYYMYKYSSLFKTIHGSGQTISMYFQPNMSVMFDNKLVFTANSFVSWQTLYLYFPKVCYSGWIFYRYFTASVFNSVSKICSV